jgi:hypothetical protein
VDATYSTNRAENVRTCFCSTSSRALRTLDPGGERPDLGYRERRGEGRVEEKNAGRGEVLRGIRNNTGEERGEKYTLHYNARHSAVPYVPSVVRVAEPQRLHAHLPRERLTVHLGNALAQLLRGGMGCVSGGYEFVEVRVCGGRARGWCEKCNSLLFGSV